jgi:hypothetical protein
MLRFKNSFIIDQKKLRLSRLPPLQQFQVREEFPNLKEGYFEDLKAGNFEEVEEVADWILWMIQTGYEWSQPAVKILQDL